MDYAMAAIVRFQSLLKLKLNIGRNDLRIGAIALETNAVVVTANTRDFGRIPGLVIEDWTV
jgi:tRNA(fMet)-specific endonuclease VapC